jgi:UDP-N-acetylglucosamine 2-epimerase (non-hydrolysing)
VLSVPYLTLRESTERPITLNEGTIQLFGRDPDLIVKVAHKVLAALPPQPANVGPVERPRRLARQP